MEGECVYMLREDLRTAIKQIKAKFKYAIRRDGVDYSETIYFFEDGSIEVGYRGVSWWVTCYDLYLSDIDGKDEETLIEDIVKIVTNENICFC